MQVSEFKLLKEKNRAFKILDVRTPSEFEGFNFGGINLPMDDLFSNLKRIETWKTESFVIICGTGLLSNIAVKVLKSKGFQFPENLNGGIEEYLTD